MVPPAARLIVVVLASANAMLAQKVISAKAGLVLYVQGRASVEGGPLSTGEHLRQLKAGESLSTERGRAEVLLNPGIILRLGDRSRLRMDDVNLTDACVSLESGSAVVTVKYLLKDDRIRLIAGGSIIVMRREGVYRLDLGPADMPQGRLRVFSGHAEVHREGSAAVFTVKRGLAMDLDDSSKIAKFDVKDTDALERWADVRSRTLAPRSLRPQPPRIGWLNNTPIPDASQSAAPTSSGRF